LVVKVAPAVPTNAQRFQKQTIYSITARIMELVAKRGMGNINWQVPANLADTSDNDKTFILGLFALAYMAVSRWFTLGSEHR